MTADLNTSGEPAPGSEPAPDDESTTTSTDAAQPRRPRNWRHTVRVWGAGVIAIAALGIAILLAPISQTDRSEVRRAMSSDLFNQASAKTAPQQTVVNGWTARDLLEVIANDVTEPVDHRPEALLTLAVLAICLGLATTPAPSTTASDRKDPS